MGYSCQTKTYDARRSAAEAQTGARVARLTARAGPTMAKRHGKRIVDEVRAMVHVLRAEGKTYPQIAWAGQISKRSVCSILRGVTFNYDYRIARVMEERIRAWSDALAARLDIDRDQLELMHQALDQAHYPPGPTTPFSPLNPVRLTSCTSPCPLV